MSVNIGAVGDAGTGISDRIRIAAEKTGTAATALGATVGVAKRTWQRYLAGQTPPSDVLARVAEVTGADGHWLLTGQGDPPPLDRARGALIEVTRIALETLGANGLAAVAVVEATRPPGTDGRGGAASGGQ